MVDAAGTSAYTYYAGGLLKTEDGPWSSDIVTNYYNTARLRSGLHLGQPTGTWTNGFIYDAARRLSTVIGTPGTFTYTYKGAGSLVDKLALPNTSYITNTHDSVARLTGTYLKHSSHTNLNLHEYLYNAGSQRVRHTRTDASYYTNTYDAIGQLKVADSTTASEDRGYLYDEAWNLSTRTNNGATTTFSVNSKNELTAVATYYTCTSDTNGNLTSRIYDTTGPKTYTYEYDAENQLKAAYTDYTSTPSGSRWKTEFVYDGRGRLRVRKEYGWNVSAWQLSTETRYVYDGMRVIQERNSGNTPTVGYTRGNDLSATLEGAGGIGGLLARSHTLVSGTFTNNNYYHADGGGNVTYMVNTNQANVASYRYDPYGNTISSSGTLASANVYRFSSKEVHLNSGMYYYGYRFYDPNLQRWLNRDPLGEYGGINLYSFTANNPNTRVDLNGYVWVSTPNPPPDDDSTTVCMGGKPAPRVVFKSPETVAKFSELERKGYYCAQSCSFKHEEEHIKDILAQNPNICQNVKDGTVIKNPDPKELLDSEMKAHQAEADCLADCIKKCPGSLTVEERQKKNQDWLDKAKRMRQ